MLITLQDSQVTAVIDSIGAQLISLKDKNNNEYIWQRDPQFWPRSSPVLFPIIGNCRNDQTIIEDTIYQIPKHGFCRERDFTISAQTERSVTFTITDDESTKKMYPYSFSLSLSYSLENGRLNFDYQVTNQDDKPIYYCIGAHPGFNCPLDPAETFEDYLLQFDQSENVSSIVYDFDTMQFNPSRRGIQLNNETEIPLNRELFKQDAVYFDKINSRKVSLVHKTTRKGVTVSFPGFETVAFWTCYPDHAPFVCIEPWNGSDVYSTEGDLFIHKNHVQQLAPGQYKNYLMQIQIV